MNKEIRSEIQRLKSRGAVFYCNHSGGKDSQAMMAMLKQEVAADKLVVIHAELPGVDWAGTLDHVIMTTAGYQLIRCRAGKTFFEMVEHRRMWPGPKYRQCTSDLKRGPIEKAIRADMKAKGITLAVNCVGLRAEESSARKKAVAFKKHSRLSKAGREVYEWLPIHEMLETEVFETIKAAGQKPHWAYGEGMSRLSCCFCIMASKADLTTAARLNPELYRRYVETEKRLDFTLVAGKWLPEITGVE